MLGTGSVPGRHVAHETVRPAGVNCTSSSKWMAANGSENERWILIASVTTVLTEAYPQHNPYIPDRCTYSFDCDQFMSEVINSFTLGVPIH